MRQHPEHVRSVILLAVAPTDLKMPLHHSESAARAMDLLLGECEQDTSVSAAFPQIRDDWKKVLEQLEKQPARVEYSPPGNPRRQPSKFSAVCMRKKSGPGCTTATKRRGFP